MKFISSKDIKLLKRDPNSHKGDNGRVLILGGSLKYPGAPILSALAAYRSGCDWVTVAAPEPVALALNSWPDLVTLKLKGKVLKQKHAKHILQESKRYDALLIGNGAGLEKETQKLCLKIIRETRLPKVIDADALKIISIQDCKNSILTPNKKEMSLLMKNSKARNISSLQKMMSDNIVIAKGPISKIITSKKIYHNKSGNSAMARAGTGDTLAGLCLGLVAAGNSLLQSSIAAIYINGLAGEILYKKSGYGYTASELTLQYSILLKKWL